MLLCSSWNFMTVNCHTIHNSKSCWRYHFSWKRICALKTEISPSLAPSSPLRAFPISTMLSQRKNEGWVAAMQDFLYLSSDMRFVKKFTPPDFQDKDFTPLTSTALVIKHRKNCECCPGHYLIVNHYSSMSWFKFRNLSVIVNCVTKSQIH